MQAESLEVLEKADVAPAQARAIVRAIEIEIAGATDTLATKQDLAMLENRLENSLDNGITGLAAVLRTEMAQQGAELRAELHRAIGGVTRQMYMAILGQMTVLLGFAYFFATHLR
jgi:DNA-binding FadR family transcriptional regulator